VVNFAPKIGALARKTLWTYNRIGGLHTERGSLRLAHDAYARAFNIAERLATELDKLDSERDLSVSYQNVGYVLKNQGNMPEALKAYRDSLAIVERLAKADLGKVGWQVDTAFSYWRLARYGDKPAENWQKVIDILQLLHGEGRLAPVHKKWLDQARAQLEALRN
jgi:tetratricopeptide (TPR) repeat protein